MLSWFIAMLINQNQDKVCSRDWVSPWEVFKMTMIAQAGEQDIFTKKRGLANSVWEKTEFSWGQARDGSAEQPRPQTLKRAHEDVHPRRCTRAPTVMAGWPFPLKFWRRLFQKDIASLKCSSLLLQKEICWDRTAFISPETTASAEQGFKEHRAPLMTEQSELFVLSPDFHPQCGVGHREAGPCFLPTLAQWAGKKLSFPPMTSWKFSTTGFREAEIP